MGKRMSKIIETGRGEGKIYENSIFIDSVYYEFQISQEFILSETQDGSDRIPGLKKLTGTIKPLNKRIDILAKYLELELSDKSVLKILICSSNFMRGEFEFVGS